ncbi:hypothetical protein BTO06_08510 [Tenacibaculum sp. SZ-18]|uniref:glycosyltransferase family 4 protein n=1 Tax=Tenacibaculum sp. SZ-18 TaxID=754423 RepID=UPI000C2D416E|nr:glycosyltransferase family 4 protein [Tenacibaculum sp. SZ-18]AUC15177.1 hypothetical protein BTO06_08510 [Tenacibaculum sp. SZ-18]
MKKEQIIIVIPYESSSIKTDIKILSEKFNIIINKYDWKQKSLYPIYVFQQLFFLLKNISKTQKIIIEFGGYWAVLPVLIGKIFNTPTAIILRGTDCAKISYLNYGSLRKKLVYKVCKLSYKYTSILLPVSSSLMYIENKYTTNENIQGLKYHFPKIQTPSRVIHNGLDSYFWNRIEGIDKEKNRFLAVFSDNQFYLKGGDLIIKLASKFNNCNFYIAGCNEKKSYHPQNNVHFLGKLTKKELLTEYNKAQYYFQLSVFEGFGLSLCEAMLCECIPITSSVNILPEIVGDTGFILLKKEINQLQEILNNAITTSNKNELGQKARKRIIDNFSIEKRAEKLKNTLENLQNLKLE